MIEMIHYVINNLKICMYYEERFKNFIRFKRGPYLFKLICLKDCCKCDRRACLPFSCDIFCGIFENGAHLKLGFHENRSLGEKCTQG